jgi:hypothetical protein
MMAEATQDPGHVVEIVGAAATVARDRRKAIVPMAPNATVAMGVTGGTAATFKVRHDLEMARLMRNRLRRHEADRHI